MDALTQMETRGGKGRSLFENANLTEQQRMANFANALGEGDGSGTDVADVNEQETIDLGQDLGDQNEQGADDDAGEQQEQPTPRQGAEQASRDDGVPTPSIDLENLERTLAADVGKKAAKTIVDSIARPLAAQVGGVAAQAAQVSVERLVTKFGSVYPELKRQAATTAVVQTAIALQQKGDTDEVAFKRALTAVYGDRKREMRDQTTHQMSAPQRGTGDAPVKATRAQADIAALHHLQRHPGDVRGAQALKQRLMNG